MVIQEPRSAPYFVGVTNHTVCAAKERGLLIDGAATPPLKGAPESRWRCQTSEEVAKIPVVWNLSVTATSSRGVAAPLIKGSRSLTAADGVVSNFKQKYGTLREHIRRLRDLLLTTLNASRYRARASRPPFGF